MERESVYEEIKLILLQLFYKKQPSVSHRERYRRFFLWQFFSKSTMFSFISLQLYLKSNNDINDIKNIIYITFN